MHIHRHSQLDVQGADGQRSSNGTESVWSLLQVIQLQHFQATPPSLNHLNKFISYNVAPWHVLCLYANHVISIPSITHEVDRT